MIAGPKVMRGFEGPPAWGPTLAAALLVLGGVAGCDAPARRTEAPAAAPYTVYVTSEVSGELVVIDGQTRTVVARTMLGKRPRGVRLSPDGGSLFVALSGSPIGGPHVDESTLPPPDRSADGIGVFDIAQGKLARILRGVSDPEQLAVAGGRVFVSSEDTGALIVLDAADGRVLANLPVGGEPEGVTVSPDGLTVAVTSEADHRVAFVDARTAKLLGSVTVGERPRTVTFSHDSRRAYVPGETDGTLSVIDVPARRLLQTVRLAGVGLLPMDTALSPDGQRLYVSTGRGGSVLALNAQSLSQEGSVAVGKRPWGVALSPDGRFLFSANGPSNDVSVVDTATMTVVTRIPVPGHPWGLAVTTGGEGR